MTWHTGLNFQTSVCVGESRWPHNNHKHNFWHHVAMGFYIYIECNIFKKQTRFDNMICHTDLNCQTSVCADQWCWTYDCHRDNYSHILSMSVCYLCWMQYNWQNKQWLDTPVSIFRHRFVSVNAAEFTITPNTIFDTILQWVFYIYIECNIFKKTNNVWQHDLSHRSKFSDLGVCRSMMLNLRLSLRQLFTHSVYECVLIMLDAI
jgi:hypothetical protein